MDQLSDELLLYVFNEVAPPIDTFVPSAQVGLAAVCLVSRQFYRVANPLLYQSIILPPESKHHRVTFLLRTLKETPVLKKFVQRIHHKIGCSMPEDGPSQQIEHHQNYSQLLTAFLAFQCPSLSHLWIRMPTQYLSLHCAIPLLLKGICRSALGSPLGLTHSFANLRTLHVDLQMTKPWPAKYTFPLFLLPTIQELTLTGLYPDRSHPQSEDTGKLVYGHEWTWPVRSCTIEKLSLLDLVVPSEVVSNMISCCKSLQKFNCEAPWSGQYEDPGWFNQISEALLCHADSLEDVSLGLSVINRREHCTWHRFLDLQRLTLVKRLRINYNLATNVTTTFNAGGILPPNVEFIHFEIWQTVPEKIGDFLQGLLSACATKSFLALKKIRLRFRSCDLTSPLPFNYEELKALFNNQGITLDLVLISRFAAYDLYRYDSFQEAEQKVRELGHVGLKPDVIQYDEYVLPVLKTFNDVRSEDEKVEEDGLSIWDGP
ncbi:hypothetical protein CC80DRAFT_326627 [Byssothecium circinans]|uniref:Uncharacterized protein n=1 Tax=Byssothecium circinans TaxID=147558 RepID=A0A6A5U3Y1_9PLEO|nr:hypothetical protein CC80DRAFT_326627 [Byssothecium circinans]